MNDFPKSFHVVSHILLTTSLCWECFFFFGLVLNFPVCFFPVLSQQQLGGGNSNIFYFHPENWGRFPILTTVIFFKWVGSTTNQKRMFFFGGGVGNLISLGTKVFVQGWGSRELVHLFPYQKTHGGATEIKKHRLQTLSRGCWVDQNMDPKIGLLHIPTWSLT